MAALPPRSRRPRLRSASRPRARRGSLERPINTRTYRGTWLLVAIPLLIAAFSVRSPQPLPRPILPATFEAESALALTRELARLHPDRRPGSPRAHGAAEWVAAQLRTQGFRPVTRRFRATLPGYGEVELENIHAVVPGQSPDAIVVMAHRDDTGATPGANDNGSGTAALLELARSYANPSALCAAAQQAGIACPAHTVIFLSTDGGAFGAVGADRFAKESAYRDRVVTAISLDAIAGDARARLHFAGDAPRSASPVLLRTAAVRIAEQAGQEPDRPSALRQLVDLGFPFSLHEQAPFIKRGIPAVTISSGPERPDTAAADTPDEVNPRRLAQLGSATQELLSSLDQGLELATNTRSHVFLGTRTVPGWALQLVLFGALAPFLIATVDLFARCRRRRIRLAPAWRSLRSRLAFWLWCGTLFAAFGLLGAWPEGVDRPPLPGSDAASNWPVLWLAVLAVPVGLGWLVARERLLPRRAVTVEEELAGHTVSLLALAVVALLVVAINPFALVFLLPSLHAWLWIPQLRGRRLSTRFAVLALGLAGPLLLLASFAHRYGLGLDAPWYLASLVSVGYVPLPLLIVVLAWAAAGSQVAALVVGRYAPYPGARERPPRGPIREVVRRAALAARARPRRTRTDDEAEVATS